MSAVIAKVHSWWSPERTPGRRRQDLGWWCITCSILALGGVAAYILYRVFGSHHHQYDLMIYRDAVRFWLHGNSIYDYTQSDPVNGQLGFTYPPFAALLMAPMVLLPTLLLVLMTLGGMVLANAAWCYLLARERILVRPAAKVVLITLVSGFTFLLQPLGQNIGFGQINIFLALLVTADILVLQKRHSQWSGVGIGLAMAIKLTPGIFLFYLLLRKDWRALIVAIGTSTVATAVAAIALPGDTKRYFTELLWHSDRVGHLDNTTNQSINGFLARLAAPSTPDTKWWAILSLTAFAFGLIRIRQAIRVNDTLAALTLTGVLGVLISPVSWIHHIVWVVPALLILGNLTWRHRSHTEPPSERRSGPSLFFLYLLVGLAGLYLWFVSIRQTFELPDVYYVKASVGQLISSDLQLGWLVLCLLVLPLKSTGSVSEVESVRPG